MRQGRKGMGAYLSLLWDWEEDYQKLEHGLGLLEGEPAVIAGYQCEMQIHKPLPEASGIFHQ